MFVSQLCYNQCDVGGFEESEHVVVALSLVDYAESLNIYLFMNQ